jgi:hypothetical protein
MVFRPRHLQNKVYSVTMELVRFFYALVIFDTAVRMLCLAYWQLMATIWAAD